MSLFGKVEGSLKTETEVDFVFVSNCRFDDGRELCFCFVLCTFTCLGHFCYIK